MNRYFTLHEAEALLPRLSELLERAVEAKRDAESRGSDLDQLALRITMAGGMEINPAAAAEQRLLRDRAVETAKQFVEEIQESGCVVKDLDTGLLDFPARLGEREVFLCWKLGEPRIDYWHDLDSGFAGRRSIRDEFGDRGDADRPN